MFCRKCGAALPGGSAFCPKCGTPVSGVPEGTGGNSSGLQTAGGKRFSLLSVRGWFSVQGRMARQELWIRVLILLGIGYILNYFAMQLPDDTESYSGAQTAFMFAALAVCIVLAVSCYCIYVRRLHDINSSGYVVIPIIIIDLSVLVVDIMVTDDSSIFGFEDLVNAIELVILGSIRGTEGQNRFGPDPKARRSGRG